MASARVLENILSKGIRVIRCNSFTLQGRKTHLVGNGHKTRAFCTEKLDTVNDTAGSDQTKVSQETEVVLKGMPYNTTEEDIAKFFTGLDIVPAGITLPKNWFARKFGIAYVKFSTTDMAKKALEKDMDYMGKRYIKIYRAIKSTNMDFSFGTENSVHMRGLPWKTTESDIKKFFSPLNCVKIEILLRPDGKQTGLAVVDFETEKDAAHAMTNDRKTLRNRYIELYLKSAPYEGKTNSDET